MEGGERGGCSERCPGGWPGEEGGETAALGARRPGREGQGPGSESQGLSHSRCPPSPEVQPASVAGTLAVRVQRRPGVARGWLLPPPLFPGLFFHLQQAICQRRFGTKEGAVGGLLQVGRGARSAGQRETPAIKRQIEGFAHSGCRGSRHFVLACVSEVGGGREGRVTGEGL